MKLVRKLHLYLSVFFAPLLLLFIGTGWWQTVSPERMKGLEEAESWTQKLQTVHVEQIYPVDKAEGYSTWLFKYLVIAMSISLIISIGLGIYLAFRSSRKQWTVWLCLVLGLIVPMLFLWLGQKR